MLDFKYNKRKKNLVTLNKPEQYLSTSQRHEEPVSRKVSNLILMPLKSAEGHRSSGTWKGQVPEGRGRGAESSLQVRPFPSVGIADNLR